MSDQNNRNYHMLPHHRWNLETLVTMFKLIASLFVVSLFVCSTANAFVVVNPKVIDGDTIDTGIVVEGLPNIHARVSGIDTPELHNYHCSQELLLARKAKEFTSNFIKGKSVIITPIKWDKYGGRLVAVVMVDDVELGAELLKNGLAHPFTGQGKKQSWCQ